MASGRPTSILVPIDRRDRLEAEPKKLEHPKREALDLHKHVQMDFEVASEVLDELAGRFDRSRVGTTCSVKIHSRIGFGVHTRLTFGALNAARG